MSPRDGSTLPLTDTQSGGEADARTRVDAPGDALGRTVGRYQVRRLLGEGGMGRVYLARDLILGRSVALKLVGPGLHADQFLDEARTIAMLNHPNIVQLYDFGEHGTGVFLALEYVRGETLRDRMQREPMGLDEALRYVRAIAEALVHAHAAGVIHCDLKPSNIMVGRDGRLRVVDFGIARTREAETAARAGTPDWMAPEQWLGGELSPAIDVWALALLCVLMVTGRHPLGDDPGRSWAALRGPVEPLAFGPDQIPAGIATLVALSLERDPTVRPSATRWFRALSDAVDGNTGREVDEEAVYPGLAAFQERQARFFFGREADLDELVERLRDTPILPIIGPSGVGKSSFLFAGLIPRLRAIDAWIIVTFRPGADPVGALVRQLAAAIGGQDGDASAPTKAEVSRVRDELLGTPTLLAARLVSIARARRRRVLVAVDQLEEIFTHGVSEHERERFLAMLFAAADDHSDPVRTVFTIREDYVGRLVDARSMFVLQPLSAEALRRTISGPLLRCGYTFDDPRVLEELHDEVGRAEVADLPLLQFVCRALWDGRDRKTRKIQRATYVAMGGLAGALARHAERAVAELSAAERQIARQILLQLVAGTTRRSVAREVLCSAFPDGSGADHVLRRLVDARLLVQRASDDEGAPVIEIAHESLLASWTQLARWIAESQDERRLLRDLEDATALWERRGARVDETWTQADISAAKHRAAKLELALPANVHGFLDAGEQRHRVGRRRRRFIYGTSFAMVGVVAIVASIWIGRYLEREALIDANMGTVDLVLQPFDLTDEGQRRVSAADLPSLTWSLYGGVPDEPGASLGRDVASTISRATVGTAIVARVRARAGLVYLRVDHRGRAGETCAPSWVRIQSFPGYLDDSVPRLEIEVPTCRASVFDTIEVPAGPFIYGGEGDLPSIHYGEDDYTAPEVEVDLPRFTMDRTETPNAALAPFLRLSRITGFSPPVHSPEPGQEHDLDDDYPATAIDIFQAQAFCRYMGKDLPTDHEWVKAARGGLTVDGVANPAPRRLYPWGTAMRPDCLNEAPRDSEDGIKEPAVSNECGAGPYGHLNLVGNVAEWIRNSTGPTNSTAPTNLTELAVIRGGSAYSPPALEHTSTLYMNYRNPQRLDYSVGLRCVSH